MIPVSVPTCAYGEPHSHTSFVSGTYHINNGKRDGDELRPGVYRDGSQKEDGWK